MKNRILIMSIIGLIFFNSCSTDNNLSNSNSQELDPNTILPKIIYKEYLGGSAKFTFYYNANKLEHIDIVSTDYNGSNNLSAVVNYTYNGSLITNIIANVSSNPSSISGSNNTFIYNSNNQLTEINSIASDGSLIDNTTFVYNSNATVTRTTTNSIGFITTDNFTFNNDYLWTITSSNNNNPYQNKLHFNDSYCPTRNILGFSNISISGKNVINDLMYGKNLIWNETSNGPDYYYTYTYNDILFPTSISEKISVGSNNTQTWNSTTNIIYNN